MNIKNQVKKNGLFERIHRLGPDKGETMPERRKKVEIIDRGEEVLKLLGLNDGLLAQISKLYPLHSKHPTT